LLLPYSAMTDRIVLMKPTSGGPAARGLLSVISLYV
jgi:hypothetical protein